MYTWTPTSRTDKNLLQTTIENEDKNTELREKEKKGKSLDMSKESVKEMA